MFRYTLYAYIFQSVNNNDDDINSDESEVYKMFIMVVLQWGKLHHNYKPRNKQDADIGHCLY